jgi:hypothetical protein
LSNSDRQLPLRVTLVQPPAGVTFCLQRGKAELVSAVRSEGDDLSFDLGVRVGDPLPDGRPSFLGPFTQGPREARFVYVSSGVRAGEAGSGWDRRAKVPLSGISWTMIEETLAAPGAVLEARILGTSRDGGPVCATVPLLDGGWRVVRASGSPASTSPPAPSPS